MLLQILKISSARFHSHDSQAPEVMTTFYDLRSTQLDGWLDVVNFRRNFLKETLKGV